MISASARRLSVFKNVVDAGGFNAAAIALGIAQPSVGAHVKALESQIGQPLFLRHRGSRPRLTKAGEALYAFATDVLHKAAETTHALSDLKAAQAREIAIAVHRDVASHFIPGRLTTFRQKHPRVRVVTRIGTIEEVIGQVREHTVDLGLLLATGPISGLASDVLAHEPMVLVAAPGHALARRDAIPPREIAAHPFVTGLRTSRYFQLVSAALSQIGIAQVEVAMELQESSAVKEMVRHGAGIALLPRCAAAAELEAGTLVALRPQHSPQDLELRCAYRAPATEMTQKFMQHLRSD
jgi:DNA-binding transcriptional LysR family regulator